MILQTTQKAKKQAKSRTTCTSPQHPFKVVVVEIGAGHGKLSLHMARAFAQHPMADTQIKVICTDFHAALFEEQLLSLPWIQVGR